MKPNSLVAFFGTLGIGIVWCFVLLETRNALWFLLPVLILLVIWLIYTRRDIRYYLHPKALTANNNGAKCLNLDQYEKAMLFFNESIRLYPNNPLAFSNRGLTNIYLGHISEAISDAGKAIELRKNFPNPYAVRALAHFHKRNYEYALKDCETAISISNKYPFVYIVRGQVYFHKNQYDLAIQDYQHVLEGASERKKTYRATIYTSLSLAYWFKGDQEQTFKMLDKAIEIAPKSAIPYSYRASIRSRNGDLNEALDDAKHALALSPLFYHAYGAKGQVYFLQAQYSDSLAAFQKSEELKSNDKFAIAGQAVCYYVLGQKDEAKRLWQALIKIDPEYIGIEALVNDCRPATKFVETARQLISELIHNQGESNAQGKSV